MIIHGKDLPEINEKTKYDVIILAGQSNAVGFGTGETLYPFTPSDEMLEIIDTFPIRFDVGEDGKSKLVMPMPPEICLRKLQDRFAYERNNACLANAFAEGYINRGYRTYS